MYAICIEASHAKGCGHLYRAINFIAELRHRNIGYVVIINRDSAAESVLNAKGIAFVNVDLNDGVTDWEEKLIEQYNIKIWVNDRLNTDRYHAERVKSHGVKLITFDDRGAGAAVADLHIAALCFNNNEELQGVKVLTGARYLILNREISRYKRVRTSCNKVLVSMGGSDTYGVTPSVVRMLCSRGVRGTVITGPAYQQHEELERIIGGQFIIKNSVPSLIEEFWKHDLAVTGGGITPFEANASGLPCIVVATEPHECEIGRHLHRCGSSVFAGFRDAINDSIFAGPMEIEKMSLAGIKAFDTEGLNRILDELDV